MKLNTIQKRENLNAVFATDHKGKGGAHYRYEIETGDVKTRLLFQNGPRKEVGSISGVLDVDLLEICRHRLQCFQDGPYASRENAVALTKIEEALMWLNRRVEDRIERNVLGKDAK